MKKIFTIILFIFIISDTYSQKISERGEVRKGNSLYKKGSYNDAEMEYRRALQKNPQSANVKYNLANAIYRQAHYEVADSLYKSLIKNSIDSTRPPQTYHNLGNSNLKQAIKDKEEQGQHFPANQEKLKESIEAYKKFLKLNPNDMETKSNLAYAQKLLSKNDGGSNDNQQNQDKNQDKNQDNNQNNENPNQDKQDNKDEQQQQQQQQGMSKQDIEKMLDAIRAQEEKTKEKVDKEKANAAKKQTPEKNW